MARLAVTFSIGILTGAYAGVAWAMRTIDLIDGEIRVR